MIALSPPPVRERTARRGRPSLENCPKTRARSLRWYWMNAVEGVPCEAIAEDEGYSVRAVQLAIARVRDQAAGLPRVSRAS